MKVYFVRHGESVSNARGSLDAGKGLAGDQLTKLGKQQARLLGKRLEHEGITRIFTSDMRRAIETGREINSVLKSPPIEKLDGIFEYRQGDAWYSPDRNPEDAFQYWMPRHSDNPNYKVIGAESFADVTNRVKKLMNYVEALKEPGPILVVSHGNFLRFFLGVVILRESFKPKYVPNFWNIETENTGISIFSLNEGREDSYPQSGGWQLLTWMDHAHL